MRLTSYVCTGRQNHPTVIADRHSTRVEVVPGVGCVSSRFRRLVLVDQAPPRNESLRLSYSLYVTSGKVVAEHREHVVSLHLQSSSSTPCQVRVHESCGIDGLAPQELVAQRRVNGATGQEPELPLSTKRDVRRSPRPFAQGLFVAVESMDRLQKLLLPGYQRSGFATLHVLHQGHLSTCSICST